MVYLLFWFFVTVQGQSPLIDSISILYHNADSDSLRAALALELSAQTYRSDTELAKEWGEVAIRHARQAKHSLLEASSISTVGVAYYYQGNWEKALDYYFRSLAIAEEYDITFLHLPPWGISACCMRSKMIIEKH